MSEAEKEAFRVTDDQSAEWCLNKIKEAKRDVEAWRSHYEAQMKKIEDAANSSIAYFTALLEDYFESVPHKKTKTQESYELIGAKLVKKQQQPKFEIDDEQTVKWLEENFMSQLVKTKKTADWSSLKKLVTVTADGCHVANDDGEIVPGISVTQREDVFKIEMEDEQ